MIYLNDPRVIPDPFTLSAEKLQRLREFFTDCLAVMFPKPGNAPQVVHIEWRYPYYVIVEEETNWGKVSYRLENSGDSTSPCFILRRVIPASGYQFMRLHPCEPLTQPSFMLRTRDMTRVEQLVSMMPERRKEWGNPFKTEPLDADGQPVSRQTQGHFL